MLALERRNLILEKLQAEKRVVVSELSQLYSVSEETIRRDLDKLEKEGLATKSYGGAVINEDVGIDLPFNIRKNQNVQGKQKMAEIAASMVNDGDHIFLDASTTAVFVAKALKKRASYGCYQFHGNPPGTLRCIRLEYHFHRRSDEGGISCIPGCQNRGSDPLLLCGQGYFFL